LPFYPPILLALPGLQGGSATDIDLDALALFIVFDVDKERWLVPE
jgi:hypothetical protein